jgi:hypothetical protein
MPNGIYPIPPFHQNAGESPSARPTLAQRLKSWWQRSHFDEQLRGRRSRRKRRHRLASRK